MKRFDPQVGGHDLRLDDLVILQTSYSDALKSLLLSLEATGTCVLSGVNVTQTVSTMQVDFTDGWIAINGEIYYSPVQSMPLLYVSVITGPNRIFAKISSTVISPSSPVTYQDGSTHNVHYERQILMKYFNPADGDIEGTNGYSLDAINAPRTVAKGMITEWEPEYAGEENVLFDSTGLGIGRMRGWAMCNGLNLTSDLRGQFTYMPSVGMRNPAALIANVLDSTIIGQQIGRKAQSILKTNMPAYNLRITDPGHSHRVPRSNTTGGGGSDAYDVSGGAVYQTGDAGTEAKYTGIVVSSDGDNTPLPIVPPATGMIKIKRIA